MPARILRQVVGRGGLAVAAGLLLGLLASGYAARSVGSLLFGIEPVDPVACGTGALVAVVVIALIRPVRAALRVEVTARPSSAAAR